MDYKNLSLYKYRELFNSLGIPEPESLPGIYKAAFVGPGWFTASAGPALVLTGLGGWWGKEIHADGTAINIVSRAGKFSRCFQMQFVTAKSFIDKRSGLALHYQPGSPFPWMYVVDEIRRVDGKTLLGMTIANLPGLRGLALPFILERTE